MLVLFCQSGVRSLDVKVHKLSQFLLMISLHHTKIISYSVYICRTLVYLILFQQNTGMFQSLYKLLITGMRIPSLGQKDGMCWVTDSTIPPILTNPIYVSFMTKICVMCVKNQLSRVRKSQKEYPNICSRLCNQGRGRTLCDAWHFLCI